MQHAHSAPPYIPPHHPAQSYACRALEVLEEAERLDVRLLAFLLAPSNVLALAGLRSYSPYNDALPADVDSAAFGEIIAKYDLLWLDEQPNIENPPLASFALVNFHVVDRLYEQYPLQAVTNNGRVRERSEWGFFAWQAGLDIALARAMENDELPHAWLKDWWSPMNTRFGMLLGYPGVAIEAFVDAESRAQTSGLINILVAEGRFNSASVAFVVRSDQRDHDDAVGTITTWKETLKAVYARYPSKKLMTNRRFSDTVKAKR